MNRYIYKDLDKYIRVLCKNEKGLYVINCDAKHMPYWIDEDTIKGLPIIEDKDIFSFIAYADITPKHNQIMHARYTAIASIIPFLADDDERTRVLNRVAADNDVSHVTIREWLCKYLASQDIRSLLPKERAKRELTDTEKNIRWALNKYYYTSKKNTLTYSYRMMLKEKYCDEYGTLYSDYPSFFQFRYFYKKTNNPQKESIRREGIKKYQRDKRPLLGDGVQEFAPYVGIAMLDSTIADIYLVNDYCEVIGRPLITACIDANTQLCCGYSLGWEGGIYSVRKMLQNVISDKVKYCQKFGITISEDIWPCNQLPAILITDKGAEYDSENLSQITELGVKIETLSAFRPEQKGPVEKFFSLVQDYYKPHLKGAGTIEPDFRSRGAKDYRKEASLTLQQFETILIKCIIFYNSSRIINNYPYTPEMLKSSVLPYANKIWEYKVDKGESNLLDISSDALFKTLLPKVRGKFTRKGLIVNKARYKNESYLLEYLEGKEVIVSYNPDDVSIVYLNENGYYIQFVLIESRYSHITLNELNKMRETQRSIIESEEGHQLQASIDLINSITAIRSQTKSVADANISNMTAAKSLAIKNEHNNSIQEDDNE